MASDQREVSRRDLGAWNVDDLKETVGINAGIGADAGLPNDVRFASGIVKLVRRQIAEQVTNPTRPAVFLLEPNARALRPDVGPKRIPMLDNGLTPIAGRLWYVNEAVVSGKYVELEDSEDDDLFRMVTDVLQLGHVPAVIVELRTTVPSVRYYPHGLAKADAVQTLAIASAVTLNNIFKAIDHVHRTALVTPEAHSAAGKLWEDAAKWWPVEKAEDLIQLYLRIGLTTWFPTCDIRFEERSVTGRLDLKIEESDALDRTRFTRHAILELKVLRSFGSTGRPSSPKDTRSWIKTGVTQAATYGKDWKARKAALCCFDMRKDETGQKCFAHVRRLAQDLRVELRVWFLFSSSARYREFLRKSVATRKNH